MRGPYLVIAPLSTIPHWYREFSTWTDMNAIVYHGSTAARNLIRRYEFRYAQEIPQKKVDNKKIFKFSVLITTYET
eukprot:SAG11_NODE_37088_length_258_cov_0.981132_1_plen_75_part_01